jgi:hypothetical protein
MVYHHFNVHLSGDKRSPEQLRKLFAPLVLAKVEVLTPDDSFQRRLRREGVKRRWYRVYIRTRAPYEKVQAVIKAKPGVTRVWPPPPHIFKRTVTKLPVPRISVGLPLDVPHDPDRRGQQKKREKP